MPNRDEQIAAYWHSRAATDKEYTDWDSGDESQEAEAARPDDSRLNQETAAPENTGDISESPSIETAALRRRVADLEAGNAQRDNQLAMRDNKLAEQDQVIAELRSDRVEQDKRIASLETDFGRLAASVSELQKQRTDQQPSAELAHRAGGGQTDRAGRAEPQHERRLPTDAVNNVIAAVAGGAINELAFHVRDLPPEYAGIGASGLAIGAGLVAVWRERRKAKDDADHRPEG